jgi:PAS domain S-box-containing protein
MAILSELLTVPSADPDNERRARLLNILLLATTGLIVLALAVTIIAGATGFMGWMHTGPLLLVILAWLAGVMIVYLINRTSPGWFGNTLFLLLLLFIPVMLEDPKELIAGRSLFVFAIPILVASVLLRPYASFIMAGFVGALLAMIGFMAHVVPNPLAMVGFLAIALVSWLSARSLEVALADLRRVNQELDRRVDERTRDLAEALAREHAESSKSQAILEGIADGVIVFDSDGQSILANPAIGRILERPHEEIIGRDIEALMGEGVGKDDQEMLVELLRERELRRSSVKFEWGDKTLSVSFAPVRATSGEVSGTAAVFRDYTQEAEVARLKSDFVSIVSHELRTPLTSIKGYLDLLLMGAAGKFGKQQQSFLEIARMNAERLHQLVNDLLDMSRIESGKVELDIRVVSLPRVIEQVISSLRKEFEDRRLTLERDIPAEVPEVFGDPGRIAQILTNLLSNACKYTKTGGATVRVRAVRGALQIDVMDTGVGISYEDQKRLFSRFFRADDTNVRQQPGTGLGLNIARSLVEMHGGEIWAESEPEMGSTFSFTLPLPAGLVGVTNGEGVEGAESADQPEPTAEALRPIVPAGPWIMVVDDDSDVANLFKLQLEQEGYRVSVVSQGSRVVEVARQLQPELITLDLLMDVDGLGVLRQLKVDPVTRDIPVVIVSVVPQPEEGLALGAADYLIKPLDEGSLLACVGRVLAELNGGSRNRILVVDDEIDIVGWLKHSLTHFGYHVTEAYDGVQALEAVEFEMPDLILLDLKMPRMDGRMTIRRLREQEATRQIPIIVLSAHPVRDESERVQMLDLGVREFLNKPVTMDRLVAEVEKHLGPAKARETA